MLILSARRFRAPDMRVQGCLLTLAVAGFIQLGWGGTAFGQALSGSPSGSSVAPLPSMETAKLEEIIVTARKTRENVQDIPVAVTTLPAELLTKYDVTSLERAAEVAPGLVITRGNSGSGLDIALRGIGSNFSSIGIEQSVAVVLDGVYYGQGRVIDEGFVDLAQMEILKGPQSLFFGKNSTAGVISMTSADPGPEYEYMGRVSYEFANVMPKGEAIISGPVSDTVGMRLVVSGQGMLGGYVQNNALAGTYTTFDLATGAATAHSVPAPSNRDLPEDRSITARLTVTYHPSGDLNVTLKAMVDHNQTGGTSWNDTPWRCPGGVSNFPGDTAPCGDQFKIYQNPTPADIAATIPDMGRHGGQLYTSYDSHGVTAKIDKTLLNVDLTSAFNYQHFDYKTNSDYDFTSEPLIWAAERDGYDAVSEEARARTRFDFPVNAMVGVYYQHTKLNFAQSSVLYGTENSLASASDRYVAFAKVSATEDDTYAVFGQLIWTFLPGWELTGGIRYTDESKSSFFLMPYEHPFFLAAYVANQTFTADQHFKNVSPDATLTWKPEENLTLYAAYKTGYKSGGFSNSSVVSYFGNGVNDLIFKPETVAGFEAGVKATLLDQSLRLDLDAYYYRFKNLQIDFYNARNLTLITTNAGSATTKGVEMSADYLPPILDGLKVSGSVQYNLARYLRYTAPCYIGQTQGQGCNITGPAPNYILLQSLNGKPTADAPDWTASIGLDYRRPVADRLVLGVSADVRYSSKYSVSPFAQPLDEQDSYANLNATVAIGTDDNRWTLAVIGKNLTNNFVATSAFEQSSTGTAPGGTTGILADQYGLFAPPRTVELQFTWRG